MTIQLNGEPYALEVTSVTVSELFVALSLPSKGKLSEVNGVFVQRDCYGETKIKDGDSVEVLQFMGGG